MNPINPSNITTYDQQEKLEYPVQASGWCQKSTRYAAVNALASGNDSNFTQRATDSSLGKKNWNPVNDFSGRHSTCAVDSPPLIKVSEASQQGRCYSKQSFDDESAILSNPVARNSSDNPKDHVVTIFDTGAAGETEEKIFSDHGPGRSFAGSPRFRDARLVEIAKQFEDGSHAITLQLSQLLHDKKRQLQSTATGCDRPAENVASLLDDANASLNTLHFGYFELLKKVENCCTLIDRIPEGRTAKPGVHFQRPEQARQDKEMLSIPSSCPHYHRRCRIQFSCCHEYYPCHRCHNLGSECGNTSVKAHQAIRIRCDKCFVEQEINEDSQYCSACQTKFSEYFCAKCKHFTSKDKNPQHCDKCGICRVNSDTSFHCDTCNVCLDKRIEGRHNCRTNSGHDLCFICSEDTFSGCKILPCSHKVHEDCAKNYKGPLKCSFCRNS